MQAVVQAAVAGRSKVGGGRTHAPLVHLPEAGGGAHTVANR